MLFSLYLENFVKGLAKTTAGVFVLFVSYPLFLVYDSYLNEQKKTPLEKFIDDNSNDTFSSTGASGESTFSKLEENDSNAFNIKIKSTLDKLTV